MTVDHLSPRTSRPDPPSWTARGLAQLRMRLFGISIEEARVERRGFVVSDPALVIRLETIGVNFIRAYNAALMVPGLQPLLDQLNAVPPEFRGFAFEGASMGLTVRDAVTPGPSLWRAYIVGPALSQHYISYVGHGWAFARLPGSAVWRARRLKGPLRWLTFDGYGFHQGYFDWPRSIDACLTDRRLHGYASRAFDQGLGRSLWFVRGADVEAIADTIGRFELKRRDDLWSGVGLAATYAGGLSTAELDHLVSASGRHRAQLAQGAVFAAEARFRAGIVTLDCERATRTLCRMSVVQAAQLAVITKPDERMPDPEGTHYEIWRGDIRRRFA